jgi:2-hydroxychromene-2-carboxylate isomerase
MRALSVAESDRRMSRPGFVFEFASTYSDPAALRIESQAAARGVAIDWHPFLLGPIFRAQGRDDSPFNLYPARGRYLWRDLARICEAQVIALQHSSQFPRNGLLAARVACALDDAGEFARQARTA